MQVQLPPCRMTVEMSEQVLVDYLEEMLMVEAPCVAIRAAYNISGLIKGVTTQWRLLRPIKSPFSLVFDVSLTKRRLMSFHESLVNHCVRSD